MKNKTSAYFCKECGYETTKWMGQCPACKQWNTMVEQPAVKTKKGDSKIKSLDIKPMSLDEIQIDESDRYLTGFGELDRVLGGGIVAGSLVLVGGDPGIGKSTILLQVCRNLASTGKKVLYISGEESLKQIKIRAGRIGDVQGDLKFLCETSVDTIRELIISTRPDVVIIDSIQTMFSEDIAALPGSISQVREATNIFLQISKGYNIALFLVGHVTKEGQVAGPRVLEHMVDTVLYFEGEKSVSYRILRAVKNRFGSTNEVGVFEMQQDGLHEVLDPSEYMLSGRPIGSSGTVVTCSQEGSRSILLEVQALVTSTAFGMARRMTTGTDYNRVNMIMAVIEKRCHMNLGNMDAYVNLTGGMKMGEPAADLAIAAAIISSYTDIPIDSDTVIFGEIGLSGEVRAVSMVSLRVKEAIKLGFRQIIMPNTNLEKIELTKEQLSSTKLVGVSSLAQMIQEINRAHR